MTRAVGPLLALLVVGCGQKPPTPPPAVVAGDGLAKQLAAMTPEQRMAYIRQHPEAMQTLSGTPSPDPQP